jgi:hypothetical protein
MEVTFRATVERLRVVERRWSLAVDKAETTIADIRSAVAPLEMADGEPTIIDSIRDAIARRNASSDRRTRLRDAEAIIALDSRTRLDRSSPKLASMIQQYEELNDKFTHALDQIVAEAREVLDVLGCVSAHRGEIGDERARKLTSIALVTPDVSSELLQQEISNATLAVSTAARLDYLFETRAETARAWIETVGTTGADVAEALGRLTASRSHAHDAEATPRLRLAALLETHSAMDPLMRVLSQHAFGDFTTHHSRRLSSGLPRDR